MWPFAKLHLVVDAASATVADFIAALSAGALEEYLDGNLVNSYLECRAAAATPVGEEATVPALFLGLINNLDGLADLVARHDWAAWQALVYQTARHGFAARIDGRPVAPLVDALLHVAEEGLAARGGAEEEILEPRQVDIAGGPRTLEGQLVSVPLPSAVILLSGALAQSPFVGRTSAVPDQVSPLNVTARTPFWRAPYV